MLLYTIHKPETEKLATIKNEMRNFGAPVIKVVNCGDYLVAIEGMHRLQAACELGIAPVLEILEQDEILPLADMDIQEMFFGETHLSAGEIAAECYHANSGCYSVDTDGILNLEFSANC